MAGVPLGREVFRVVLPVGHRLAAQDQVAFAELAGEPLVALPAESRTRRILDGAASAAGLALRHAVTVTQFATLLGFVRAGVGLALVPAGAIAGPGGAGLAVRPLTRPEPSRELGVVTLRERELSPVAAGFLGLLKEGWPGPLD